MGLMISLDDVSWIMNDLIFYGNVIVELREDMLEAMLLLGRYYRLVYGGQWYFKIVRSIRGLMMSARGLVNHLRGINFLYS